MLKSYWFPSSNMDHQIWEYIDENYIVSNAADPTVKLDHCTVVIRFFWLMVSNLAKDLQICQTWMLKLSALIFIGKIVSLKHPLKRILFRTRGPLKNLWIRWDVDSSTPNSWMIFQLTNWDGLSSPIVSKPSNQHVTGDGSEIRLTTWDVYKML